MCGIAGLWQIGAIQLDAVAAAMADAITHRGPDGSGVWVEESAGLTFSHRRLAIQDLSELGAQPMRSVSGRYTITYNGEVYNFPALRRELEGLGDRFRGGSDTEVMLAAIERWGLVPALERFVGMFAFGLWDAHTRELHLVRDRLGIKPLYFGRVGGGLVFGSDLASFHQVPGFVPAIDRGVLQAYFRYACVPGTECIFEGCEKVPPGSVLTFREASAAPRRTDFWSPAQMAAKARAEALDVDLGEATDLVEEALRVAVSDRKVADVPLGVFLSGGIDSSVVAALMGSGARTFSIGFREGAYDEASDARRVAAHLGTSHTELYVTPREAMDAVGELGGIYTEPFADSSQLPTLLVCRMARRDVTVVLSGDGGDEVFGGYNRHLWGPRVWGLASATPRGLRGLGARALQARSPAAWDAVAERWGRALPWLRVRTPGDKAHKLASLLETSSVDDLYTRLTSIWPDPSELVLGGDERARSLPHVRGSVAEQFMLRDLAGYLHDDILPKVDRASMSVALEVRVPLLDHRLVELAWRLPESVKVSKGVGKRVLREVLARHVPRELFERPKMGFGVPIDAWLRGPLRDWAEELLRPQRLREDGLLDAGAVRGCWDAHLSGRDAMQHRLWAVLMFQAWRDAQRKRGASIAAAS